MDLHPVGADGLDYQSNKAVARPNSIVVGESIRLDTGALARRKGDAKVYRAAEVASSKHFGADTIWATIPAAPQLQIQAGGFAVLMHFLAKRPAATETAYILSSRVNGQSYHVVSITLSDAGAITVTVQFETAGPTSASTAVIGDGDRVDLLVLFDAVAGTLTLYVNGEASGTPATGISSSDKPVAGAGTDWHFGVHYDPAVAGVVANTHFDGDMHGFTLITTRGIRVSDGLRPFKDMLIRHSSRLWSLPQAPYVLACYDMADVGLVLLDRSDFENHAACEAGTTDAPAVANAVTITNHVGHAQFPNRTRTNIFGSHGRMFYEFVA